MNSAHSEKPSFYDLLTNLQRKDLGETHHDWLSKLKLRNELKKAHFSGQGYSKGDGEAISNNKLTSGQIPTPNPTIFEQHWTPGPNGDNIMKVKLSPNIEDMLPSPDIKFKTPGGFLQFNESHFKTPGSDFRTSEKYLLASSSSKKSHGKRIAISLGVDPDFSNTTWNSEFITPVQKLGETVCNTEKNVVSTADDMAPLGAARKLFSPADAGYQSSQDYLALNSTLEADNTFEQTPKISQSQKKNRSRSRKKKDLRSASVFHPESTPNERESCIDSTHPQKIADFEQEPLLVELNPQPDVAAIKLEQSQENQQNDLMPCSNKVVLGNEPTGDTVKDKSINNELKFESIKPFSLIDDNEIDSSPKGQIQIPTSKCKDQTPKEVKTESWVDGDDALTLFISPPSQTSTVRRKSIPRRAKRRPTTPDVGESDESQTLLHLSPVAKKLKLTECQSETHGNSVKLSEEKDMQISEQSAILYENNDNTLVPSTETTGTLLKPMNIEQTSLIPVENEHVADSVTISAPNSQTMSKCDKSPTRDVEFTQISPTALSAMCEAAQSPEERKSHEPSQNDTPLKWKKSINTPPLFKKSPRVIEENTDVNRNLRFCSKTNNEGSGNVPNKAQSFSLVKKAKLFSYPNIKQIKETCPTKVFNYTHTSANQMSSHKSGSREVKASIQETQLSKVSSGSSKANVVIGETAAEASLCNKLRSSPFDKKSGVNSKSHKMNASKLIVNKETKQILSCDKMKTGIAQTAISPSRIVNKETKQSLSCDKMKTSVGQPAVSSPMIVNKETKMSLPCDKMKTGGAQTAVSSPKTVSKETKQSLSCDNMNTGVAQTAVSSSMIVNKETKMSLPCDKMKTGVAQTAVSWPKQSADVSKSTALSKYSSVNVVAHASGRSATTCKKHVELKTGNEETENQVGMVQSYETKPAIAKCQSSHALLNTSKTTDFSSLPQAGFSSASGKPIKLSEKSMNKAKQIFNEVSNKVKTELSEKQHDTGLNSTNLSQQRKTETTSSIFPAASKRIVSGFTSASGNSIKISNLAMDKAKRIVEDGETEKKENTIPQKTTLPNISDVASFQGFACASGKAIKLSEKSLHKAKRIMEDIGNEISAEGNVNQTFSTNSLSPDKNLIGDSKEKSKRKEQKSVPDLKRENSTEDNFMASLENIIAQSKEKSVSNDNDYSQLPKGFRPFKAPRSCKPSNKSKNEVEKLTGRGSNPNVETKIETGQPIKEVTETEAYDSKANDINAVDLSKTRIETDNKEKSNKTPDIPDDNLMEDEDCVIEKYTFTQIAEISESTAAFMDIEESQMIDESHDIKVEPLDGRRMAYQSQIKSEIKSNNCKENDYLVSTEKRLISSNSNLPEITESEEISLNEEGVMQLDQKSFTASSCHGFQTASGKGITVSEKAMATAKKLVDEVREKDVEIVKDSDIPSSKHKTHPGELPLDETTFGKESHKMKRRKEQVNLNIGCRKPEIKTVAPYNANAETPLLNRNIGCKLKADTTTKGEDRHNSINHEEIEHSIAKTLFSEFDDFATEEAMAITNDSKTDLKEAPIKTESETVADTNSANTVNQSESYHVGFQTASGHHVAISKEAMLVAKHLLKDTLENDASTSSEDNHVVDQEETSDKDSFPGITSTNESKIYTEPVKEPISLSNNDKNKDMNFHGNAAKTREPNERTQCLRKSLQTVSGKAVEVSNESLARAKHLLDTDEFSGDLAPLDYECGKEKNVTPSVTAEFHTPQFTRFQTASGDKEIFSETSLQQAKQLLSGLGNEKETAALNKGSCVNTTIYRKKTSDISEKIPGATSKFQGFQTASGSKVEISQDGLRQAPKLFSDEATVTEFHSNSGQARDHLNANIASKRGNREEINNFTSQSSEAVDEDRPIRSKENNSNDLLGQDFASGKFVGFQTAAGIQVEVSDKSLKAARALFDEASLEGNQLVPSEDNQPLGSISDMKDTEGDAIKDDLNAPGFQGFHTASGSNVKVAQEAFNTAKRKLDTDLNRKDNFKTEHSTRFSSVLEDEALRKDQANEDKPFIGFQTASGTKVSVSEQALKKAKQIFQDHTVLDVNLESVVPMQSGQKDAALAEAYVETGETHLDSVIAVPKVNQNVPFTGFQTAGGSKVTISDSALKRAKQVLDADLSLVTESDKHSEEKPMVERPLQTAKLASHKVPKATHSMSFKGFQTASGSKVKISNSALKHAKQVLGDDLFLVTESDRHPEVRQTIERPRQPANLASNIVPETKQSFKGFQKAGGSKVTISHSALNHARRVLGEEGHEATNLVDQETNIESKPFAGFQTARGKQVTVSESALRQAQSLLGETASASLHTPDKQVVPIAKKDVEMSTPSLILKGDDDGQNLNQSASNVPKTFAGFQTATGRSVQISESALIQAKQFLDDSFDISVKPEAVIPGTPNKAVVYSHGDRFKQLCNEIDSERRVCGTDKYIEAQESVDKLADDLPKNLRSDNVQRNETKGKEISNVNPAASSVEKLQVDRQRGDKSEIKPISTLKQRSIIFPITTGPHEIYSDREKSIKNLEIKAFVTIPPGDKKIDKQQGLAFYSRGRQFVYPGKFERKQQSENQEAPMHENAKSKPTFQTPVKSDASHQVTSSNITGITTHQTGSGFNIPYKKETPQSSFKTPVKASPKKPEPVKETGKMTIGDEKLQSSSQDELSGPKDEMTRSTKTNLINVPDDVKKKRLRARVAQGQLIRKKREAGNTRPNPGRILMNREMGVAANDTMRIQLQDYVLGDRPASFTAQQLYAFGVRPDTTEVTSRSAEEFRFCVADFYAENIALAAEGIEVGDEGVVIMDEYSTVGKKEFCNALLAMEGVEPKLISPDWVYNHYRWIVYKLAAYEVSFPQHFGARCLTPERVMLQLKYRYDREVDKSQRSALKKIYERDDTPAKCMVLCVADILSQPNKQPNTEANKGTDKPCILELTDGWYGIRTAVDPILSQLVQAGKLQVGDKIVTCGAELVGTQDGCSPLEAPESLMLKICANSTRRAKWFAKLGFCANPRPPPLPLSSLYPGGGTVMCVQVVVTRVYPLQFLEKQTTGASVIRTQRAEDRAARVHERDRQRHLESAAAKLQEEFERRQDAGSFEDETEMRSEFESRMRELMTSGVTQRQVTPMLKVRVAGCMRSDMDKRASTMLTIWRPGEDVTSLLCEGQALNIYNLSVGENWGKGRNVTSSCCVTLTAQRSSNYQKLDLDDNLLDLIYTPREVLCFNELGSYSSHGEVDMVGLVIQVATPHHYEKASGDEGSVQTVYMADVNGHFIGVKFWSGLQSYCLEDVVTTGSFVACCNLQWRYDNKARVQCVTVGDLSTFTQKPAEKYMKIELERLKSSVGNKDEFMSTMQDRLMHLLTSQHKMSPFPKVEYSKPIIVPSRSTPNMSISIGQATTPKSNPSFASPMLTKSASFSRGRSFTPLVTFSEEIKSKDGIGHRTSDIDSTSVSKENVNNTTFKTEKEELVSNEKAIVLKKKIIQKGKAAKLDMYLENMTNFASPLNTRTISSCDRSEILPTAPVTNFPKTPSVSQAFKTPVSTRVSRVGLSKKGRQSGNKVYEKSNPQSQAANLNVGTQEMSETTDELSKKCTDCMVETDKEPITCMVTGKDTPSFTDSGLNDNAESDNEVTSCNNAELGNEAKLLDEVQHEITPPQDPSSYRKDRRQESNTEDTHLSINDSSKVGGGNKPARNKRKREVVDEINEGSTTSKRRRSKRGHRK